ncbi:hypothetical protein F2Q70_00007809 [Brassica cretica]|uniref:Uncharacterized protein n=2 Tax=Brassica cretica TaxID=69181 RepID=A0A8S9JB81_BRACR|nr:hypothetical protein F2Q68_00000841 [Brassica cretica]KAF2611758.1 hypothetical protein F2Q70_00007809 [Brassica cretica]KAF3549719.1 hypothetical protein DY000_02001091 [Brassica cretica]
MNEEAISGRETDASFTISSSNGGRMSFSKSPRSSDKNEGDGFKKPKSRKEAWSVLKAPKPQTSKGLNKLKCSNLFVVSSHRFICGCRSFLPLVCLNPLLQYVSECESFKDRGGSAKALNLANMY